MADLMNDTALSTYLEAHANDAQLILEVLGRQQSDDLVRAVRFGCYLFVELGK
jgi:hypothetical protein